MITSKWLASIEKVPHEILQQIAVDLWSDTDLINFIASSPKIAQIICPDDCDVWKKRFLAAYDYPDIKQRNEFRVAYQLRRLVLRTFVDFTEKIDRRRQIQLEVVRDMIIETYNETGHRTSVPRFSRNLRAFASLTFSKWITVLLSSPFARIGADSKSGKPDAFLAAIQLVLSHLVLSPSSAIGLSIESSRIRYDLAYVYNFDRSFSTIYRIEADVSSNVVRQRNMESNSLRKRQASSQKNYLDLHALLHIRTFWQKHLLNDDALVSEQSYAGMAKSLAQLQSTPREWTQSLRTEITVAGKWHGTYSAVYPWPKSIKQLEMAQTAAGAWDKVDPLTLEFLSTDDYRDGYWPQALEELPAFSRTVPQTNLTSEEKQKLRSNDSWEGFQNKKKSLPIREPRTCNGPVYIRGIAPFMDLERELGKHSKSRSEQLDMNDEFKYHPYLALRVRGVIHEVPQCAIHDGGARKPRRQKQTNRTNIPGWKRVVMIVYKPSVRYLVNVLEHAEEMFGGALGVQVTDNLNTANVWNSAGSTLQDTWQNLGATASISNSNDNAVSDIGISPQTFSTTTPVTITQTQSPGIQDSIVNPFNTNNTDSPGQALSIDPTILHQQMDAALTSHLRHLTPTDPSYNPNSPFFNTVPDVCQCKVSSSCPTPPSSSPTESTRTMDKPFSASHIIALEDAYISPHNLSWNVEDGQIEYAYAYEGAIIPGGKIMMGRWWRCFRPLEGAHDETDDDEDNDNDNDDEKELAASTITTTATEEDDGASKYNPGWEVDCKGLPVLSPRPIPAADFKQKKRKRESETGQDELMSGVAGQKDEDGDGGHIEDEISRSGVRTVAGSGTRHRKREQQQQLERGPFVFWC